MKSFSRLLRATLLALLAANGATAQNRVVNANVPFNFTAGERLLPAGQYTLFSPYSNVVEIRSQDGRMITFVAASQGFQGPIHGSRLEFQRYGQRYFLRRILCPVETGMNMKISAGKPEKKVLSQQAELDLGEAVFVAAE